MSAYVYSIIYLLSFSPLKCMFYEGKDLLVIPSVEMIISFFKKIYLFVYCWLGHTGFSSYGMWAE